MNLKTYLISGLIIQTFLIIMLPTPASAAEVFFTENFETAFVNGAPPNWTKIYKTQTSTLDWMQNPGDFWYFDAAHGGLYNALLYSGVSGSHETYLITPPITFQPTALSVTLEFWHKQANWAGDQDTLKVYYGEKPTGPWNIVAQLNSDVENWTRRSINLPLTLASPFHVAFLGNARHGYGVCIDDVRVYEGNGDYSQTLGNGAIDAYAVIVGVADYLNVTDLQYCDDDAREVGNALYSLGNWKSENIVVLTDSAATKDAIKNAVQNMADAADENDTCVFFFSGHGTADADLEPYDESDMNDEYIVPYDSTGSPATNISDDELSDWFSVFRTGRFVVLIDSCYSGGFMKALDSTKGAGAVKGLGTNVPQKGDGFAADLVSSTGWATVGQVSTKDLQDNGRGIVITSSDDYELSRESDILQNGVFSYYLIEALKGAADADVDNSISAEECYDYAAPRATDFNPDQHAQIYDAVPGELELSISNSFISKLTVRAGRYAAADSISAKGELTASSYTFDDANSVTVTIDSNNMAPHTLTFPVDANTYKNGKFRCSKTEAGVKKYFGYDTLTRRFAFSASKIDLSGLDCPLTIRFDIGDYNTMIWADEATVNGKRPIPIKLLMGVTDSIRVDKIRLTHGSTADQLTVKGGFSVQNVDVNMVESDFIVALDEQAWTIPAGWFTSGKDKYTSKKALLTPDGVGDAVFRFDSGAFTLALKNADILAEHDAYNRFGLEFPLYLFNESADVYLP